MVKSIIWQFDLPKFKKTSDNRDEDNPMLDVATVELLKLTGDIDLEGKITESASDDEATDDKEEEWVDEHKDMTILYTPPGIPHGIFFCSPFL